MPHPLLAPLVAGLAEQIARRYRIAPAEAADLISHRLAPDRALAAAIEEAGTAEQVRRTRAYRDAARDATRAVYYHLRRYRPDQDAADAALKRLEEVPAGAPRSVLADRARGVAASHVSTGERLAHLAPFLDQLFVWVGPARTIVDVGCGVFPLVFSLDDPRAARVEQLWALDRDPAAIRAVTAYARARGDDRVRPVRWDARTGWPALAAPDLPSRFDVALLLKVVPVAARQEPAVLGTLASVPARLLVVSGSTSAMTRRRDIRRREAAVIRRFLAGHDVVGEFETADEVCVVARG